MNISFENVSKVSALLTVKVEKADYEEKVAKALKDFRKKASLPGFRPGQVPAGLLKKRFGTEILAEQVNKILGEELYKYIHEQKVNILGEPLANEEKTPAIDFQTQEDFTFAFDIALAPEFDAKVSGKDKLTYYTIDVDDAMVDQQLQAYAQRAGQYTKVDNYTEGDMVKGILAQLDAEGNVLEGGIQVEGATVLPTTMKSDDEKAKFADMKVNDVMIFNPAKAYADSDVELASLLRISKEDAANMKADFSFQVTEITHYEAAKMEQAFFDQILGEGVVKSEDEFRAHIKQDMEKTFVADSDFKFLQDLRKYLENRIGEVEFPEEILKRIMKMNHADKDEAFINENYQPSVNELKWHLIKEQLSDQLEVKVEQADVMETAKAMARMQFAQYGMTNVPDEYLANYAESMLKNQQQAEGLVARTVENKIVAKAKDVVKLTQKTVSMDEFNKLFQEENK